MIKAGVLSTGIYHDQLPYLKCAVPRIMTDTYKHTRVLMIQVSWTTDLTHEFQFDT